ncbi:pancreatic secretory granule membrane major glycoprotein GP2-like [Dreissena polymorpha]|uniref:pancreatic secretory granule membrane major glycoprotein GP2-like n=1 Tax=Dreissena polymorpha TaxID=45954 RepID=UPI002264FF4A|nr:pancreatic secretory granule membrane major glycoprotein GP2-like [Dreissena polymorpha]
MAAFKTLIRLLIFWMYSHGYLGTTSNPCLESKHDVLKNVGSRNAHCLVADIPLYQQLCDQYLKHVWYKTENATIRTSAPVNGNCGAVTAAWLRDFPPTEFDGVRNMTMCIREGSNNCVWEFNIEIKNCGQFLVYHLQPLPETFNCPAAYCFDSSLPCTTPAPISTASPTTENTYTQSTPIFTSSHTTKIHYESENTDDNSIMIRVCITVIMASAAAITGSCVWWKLKIYYTKRICATNGFTEIHVHSINKPKDYQDMRIDNVIKNT